MNNTLTLIFIFSVLSITSLEARVFGHDGNGGDTVYCDGSEEKFEKGHYPLDMIMAMNINYSSKLKTYPADYGLHDKMLAIIDDLSTKNSFMSQALNIFYIDFREQYLMFPHESPAGPRRFWYQTHTDPIEIADENLKVKLPKSCQKVAQAISRYNERGVSSFYVNKEDLDRKIRQAHFSWLIVHEFLWDFFDNAEDLRKFNSFLHSFDLDKRSKFFNRKVVTLGMKHQNLIFKTDKIIKLIRMDSGLRFKFFVSENSSTEPTDLNLNYKINVPRYNYEKLENTPNIQYGTLSYPPYYEIEFFDDIYIKSSSTFSSIWDGEVQLYTPSKAPFSIDEFNKLTFHYSVRSSEFYWGKARHIEIMDEREINLNIDHFDSKATKDEYVSNYDTSFKEVKRIQIPIEIIAY